MGKNFCVREGGRTLNVGRHSRGAYVHVNTCEMLPQYSASIGMNEAQAKRLAAYLDPEPASTERTRILAIAREMAAEHDLAMRDDAGHAFARDALLRLIERVNS